jgi:hypothetical protein
MGSVQNFFTSRDNNTDPATYVGQLDRLWYNPVTNSIFVSDGVTPGGAPVALATNANIVANIVTVNTVTSTTGNITVTGNLIISGDISPATETKIGGIKAGPGANISNDGTLTIDTSGLPLSFGDFTANTNILTLVNEDQDMVLATKGNAEIQLVGNIGFYRTNGFPPDPNNQFFFARDDGQIRIFVPAEDPLEGGVEIIGSATGNFITPGAPGTMLQLTGNPGIPTRLYMDGNAEYASFVARRYNGNVAAPTQVLAGQDVLRINSTAATNLGGGNVGNVAMAQIRTTALENQTATGQGSSITFTVTAIGSPANARVDVANVTVANGVTATKFTTAGTVSATGNIITANTFVGNISGLLTHRVRNAGTIADGGTLTIDFAADDLINCVWNNGLTIAGSNYVAGRVVKVMATKGTGSGTDAITLSGFTANHVSSGTTSSSYSADVTAIIEFVSTTTAVGGVYIKL